MQITPGYYWFRCRSPQDKPNKWQIVKVEQHPSWTTEYLIVNYFGGGASTLDFLLGPDGMNLLHCEFELIEDKNGIPLVQ